MIEIFIIIVNVSIKNTFMYFKIIINLLKVVIVCMYYSL